MSQNIPVVGRALLWYKNVEDKRVPIGIKVYLFKEGSTDLDFDNGVLVQKRAIEDLWSGQSKSAIVMQNRQLEAKPVSSKSK